MKIKKLIIVIILTYKYLLGNTKRYFKGKEKATIRKLIDFISWYFRERTFNTMYFAFGLNIKEKNQKDYIGKNELTKLKTYTESFLKKHCVSKDIQYEVITRDKFYANSILTANSVPCVPTIAIINQSKLLYTDGGNKAFDDILKIKNTFFIKNILLDGGDGVFSCNIQDSKVMFNEDLLSLDEFKKKLENNIWIIQQKIRSHEQFRKINDSALNTTRIVTILNRNEPEYLCGFQAFATNNELIDSWSKGSIYVGIDTANECLKEFGFCNLNDKYNSIVLLHPDSGVVFKNYPIPYLKNAVDLCINAHRFFYFNFIIGWDVAITDQGPLILEINESPGMNVAQCIDGGLRNKIEYRSELITNYLENK